MKKIFIIYCNPKSENSFSYQIAKTYLNSAGKTGKEVKLLNVYDMDFGYLSFSNDEEYHRVMKEDRESLLTPELKEAQENILWADELVFIYPVWWGGMPARLKSFIENVFQVGVVANITPESPKPVPLLVGKTAVVIQTYYMPVFVMKFFARDISFNSLDLGVLRTCGVKTRKRFDLSLAMAKPETYRKFLNKIEKFAEKN